MVFWHPDALAAIVILTAAPPGTDTTSFTLDRLEATIIRREADDGMHVIVKSGNARHQLWLVNVPDNGSTVAAIIPLDALTPHRTEAALRFWRLLAELHPLSAKEPIRRAERLVAALRALDARIDGASYRTIAETLFGAQRIADAPWKTSSLRDTVIRLARTGFAMMRGRYRTLLSPRDQDDGDRP